MKKLLAPDDNPGAVDRQKLRAMITYFVNQGAEDLGKTKLMKLLYYADFGFFAEHSRPISGATYRAYPRGPVPEAALQELRSMVGDGLLIQKMINVGGYIQESHLVQGAPSLDGLDSEEIEFLARVWEKWKGASVSSIVTATHSEAPWRSVDLYSDIPYEMAYLL